MISVDKRELKQTEPNKNKQTWTPSPLRLCFLEVSAGFVGIPSCSSDHNNSCYALSSSFFLNLSTKNSKVLYPFLFQSSNTLFSSLHSISDQMKQNETSQLDQGLHHLFLFFSYDVVLAFWVDWEVKIFYS